MVNPEPELPEFSCRAREPVIGRLSACGGLVRAESLIFYRASMPAVKVKRDPWIGAATGDGKKKPEPEVRAESTKGGGWRRHRWDAAPASVEATIDA
ncbi:MAG TPA: hypothetical protein VIT02_15720 [Burkholderiaceae bacterium]